MITSLCKACEAFFKTELPENHPQKKEMELVDKYRLGAVAAVTIGAVGGIKNWPPYNRSLLLFGMAYTGYESYKMLGNLQKIYLNENSADLPPDQLFNQLTNQAPLAKKILPCVFRVEDVKSRIFPPL